MDIIPIYKSLSDPLRVRILNLLEAGPLCVCHLMEILDCEQVKMSKQLRTMKEQGLVAAERQAQWMIYRLEQPVHALLEANLECLRRLPEESLSLGSDLRRRAEIVERVCATEAPVAQAIVNPCC